MVPRLQFGRSSERINHQIAQLELRLEELESGIAAGDIRRRIAADLKNSATDGVKRMRSNAIRKYGKNVNRHGYREGVKGAMPYLASAERT